MKTYEKIKIIKIIIVFFLLLTNVNTHAADSDFYGNFSCSSRVDSQTNSVWTNNSFECQVLRFFIPQTNNNLSTTLASKSPTIYQDTIVFTSYIAYGIAVFIVIYVLIKLIIVGAVTGDFMPKSGLFLFVRLGLGMFLLLPYQPGPYKPNSDPPTPNYQYSYAHHMVFKIADQGILLAYNVYDLIYKKKSK